MLTVALFTIQDMEETSMSINKQWIWKKRYHTYNGILPSHKKGKIMPFAATWLDLEILVLSEVRQRKIEYDVMYIWNLKNGVK